MGKELLTLIVSHSQYLFLIAGLMLLTCIFIFAKWLIAWGMKHGKQYLLSYIVGSILFINFFFLALMLVNQEEQATMFLPYLLQIIGVYGLLLLVTIGIRTIVRISKKA